MSQRPARMPPTQGLDELAVACDWPYRILTPAAEYDLRAPLSTIGSYSSVEQSRLERFTKGTGRQCVPAIKLYELRDILLFSNSILVAERTRAFIRETVEDLPMAFRHRHLQSIAAAVDDGLQVIDQIEEAAHLGRCSSHNYRHWLLDVIPRVGLFRDAGLWPLLINGEVLDMMADVATRSLAWHGVSGADLRAVRTYPVRIRRLYFLTPLTHELDPTYLSPKAADLCAVRGVLPAGCDRAEVLADEPSARSLGGAQRDHGPGWRVAVRALQQDDRRAATG